MYLDLVNLLEDEGQEAATRNFFTGVEPSLNALLAVSSRLLENEQNLILEHQRQSQEDLKKPGLSLFSYPFSLYWLPLRLPGSQPAALCGLYNNCKRVR